MKTIQKIILYAAAGAALLGGALGCGDRDSQEKPALAPSILEYKTKPEEKSELGKQIDSTFEAFHEAIEFDKKCQEELYKEEEKVHHEAEKEFGSFEDWLKRRTK